jgi:mannose-6-phosphate isomerase-like protein (cupin superfamily)
MPDIVHRPKALLTADEIAADRMPQRNELLARALKHLDKATSWPVALYQPISTPYRPHHHPVDEQLFMLEGEIDFWDVLAERYFRVECGDELHIPKGVIHSVRCGHESVYLMGLGAPSGLVDDFFIWDWHEDARAARLMALRSR